MSSFCPIQSKVVEKLQAHFENKVIFFWNEINGNKLGLYFKSAYLETIAKKTATGKVESKEGSKPPKELDFNVLNSQFLSPALPVGTDTNSSGDVTTIDVNWREIIFHITELANDLISLDKTNHINRS
jgi:hypothetical protein